MLTRAQLTELIDERRFTDLVGETESPVLEAKSQPYQLGDDEGKFELAKDAAETSLSATANGNRIKWKRWDCRISTSCCATGSRIISSSRSALMRSTRESHSSPAHRGQHNASNLTLRKSGRGLTENSAMQN